MVSEIRWKDLIDEGRALIEVLQREHFPVSGAFWVADGQLRLVIASRLPSDKGPIQAYTEFLRILDMLNLQVLDYIDVAILSPTDPNYLDYYESLSYRGGPNARNLQLSNAFIYFLDPDAIPVAVPLKGT